MSALCCAGPSAASPRVPLRWRVAAGKMRDSETGLDYFGARYNASGWGRFMAPDWSAAPSGVPYASFADPRSLDLYVYLEDNPTSGVDADGHASLAELYENLYPDGPIPADAAIYMAPNGGPMLLPQPVSTATEDVARRKGEAYAFALFWGSGHGRGGRPGKGERRDAAKPEGTPDPGKKVRRLANGRYEVRDPYAGKWIPKGRDWRPPAEVKRAAIGGAKAGAAAAAGHSLWRALVRLLEGPGQESPFPEMPIPELP